MIFLNALNKTNNSHLPVWFMRQAGRYLPEYQALRKQYDFRTMSHRPELIRDTTLTPFTRLNPDAIIFFSDILTCLEYMGSAFQFTENGPKLDGAGPHAFESLTRLDPSKSMSFIGEGLRLVKQSRPDKPLIGFVGAPFTLASYLIEGGTSREFQTTREYMYNQPEKFKIGLNLLADSLADYLYYQTQNGAQAVQIFDSWVGILPQNVYRELVLPSVQRLISTFKSKSQAPVILYSQPTLHLLPCLLESGADALSVDWRTPIDDFVAHVRRLSPSKIPALQGNLDPLVTTLDWMHAKPHVDKLLQQIQRAEISNQFVFNVGHGVVPETKWQTVKAVIDYVHENS